MAALFGAAVAAPTPGQTAGDPWVERLEYEMPFVDRAEWLAFMAEGGQPGDRASLAAAYPEDEFSGLVDGTLASVERVAFHSGSLILRGILVRPPGPGPFPSVVYARGGNREYGRLRFLDVVRMFGIARTGRVVLAPEYRGEGGSEGTPVLAGGDIDDVLASVDALGVWPDADTTHVSLVGSSRGGLVAAWALTRTDVFDAAVLVAPDLDVEDTARRRPAMDSAVYALSIEGYDRDPGAALRRASPLFATAALSPTPILLLHGSNDMAVHPSGTLAFSRRLVDQGHPHRLMLLEHGTHALVEHELTVRKAIGHWLGAPPR